VQDYGLALQWYRAAAGQAPAPSPAPQLSAPPVSALPAREPATALATASDGEAVRRAA